MSLHPWRTMRRLVDARLGRSLDARKVLVEGGHDQDRRVWRGAVPRLAVGLSALMSGIYFPDTWWGTLSFGVLGLAVGQWSSKRPGEASAYRSGWLDGRYRFLRQMESHRQRGDSMVDWLQVEQDHDRVHVMGMAPMYRPQEDDEP